MNSHAILTNDIVSGVRSREGHMITVALATVMPPVTEAFFKQQKQTKLASVRIKSTDGRSLSIRLDTVGARRLHEALGFAIREMPEAPADYRPNTSRADRDRHRAPPRTGT